MRKTRLLWHLHPSQFIITLIALLALTWYGSHTIKAFYLGQAAQGLEARAYLVKGKVRDLLSGNDLAALRKFCRQVGPASSTRLTVIAPDGLVLADSEEDPARMDNHGDRPEIIAALAGRLEPTTRFSYTLQKTMMYVAIPMDTGKKVIGVLRTSIPVTALHKPLRAIYLRIAVGGVVVLALMTLFAWFAARRISQPLATMRTAMEEYASGNFKRRISRDGSPEIGDLARAMNRMAERLDSRIKTVQQQHNALEAVFSSMIEGVLTVDKDERIRSMNRASTKLLGLDPAKVTGKTTLEAVRNSELQRFVIKALQSPIPVENEILLHDAGGKERFFYIRGLQSTDENGASTGALIVLNDVTNLRRLETVRRDFVANVSHELKTPITSIEGFVETLLDGAMNDPQDAKRFLEIIAKQSKRLHAIVEDLLALSRIEQEATRHEIVLEKNFVKATLKAAIQTCATKAAGKDMVVKLQCPDDLEAMMNPPLLEQAVVNLIDNAIKYSPAAKEIYIEATDSDHEMEISVRDQGVGIAVEDQSRLFERFYRVDKARSNKLGGTGLGLSIVKHIVQAHGGRISLQSTLLKGSTFSIHLPKG